MKVVRLSTLRAGRLYPQNLFLVIISVRGWIPSSARRIMFIKNSSDTIGDRTRDLPACVDKEGSSALVFRLTSESFLLCPLQWTDLPNIWPGSCQGNYVAFLVRWWEVSIWACANLNIWYTIHLWISDYNHQLYFNIQASIISYNSEKPVKLMFR